MPTPESKARWFRITPDRFVISLLLVIGLLWLSERFQWFGFNHHKGWTVLIAVAAVGVAAVVMLTWWATGLIFGWRFQFGIRTVLTFCLACSIAAGWLAVEIQRARRQEEVVVAVRNSVGMTFYDWQVDANNTLMSNSEPPEPRWLRNILGDDFFSAVVLIYDNDPAIMATELERLKELAQLRELGLSGTGITDASLEHLKELTQLRRLDLNLARVTDAGLEQLTSLTQLRVLDLNGTKVTDAGLKRLQQALPKCEIYH